MLAVKYEKSSFHLTKTNNLEQVKNILAHFSLDKKTLHLSQLTGCAYQWNCMVAINIYIYMYIFMEDPANVVLLAENNE